MATHNFQHMHMHSMSIFLLLSVALLCLADLSPTNPTFTQRNNYELARRSRSPRSADDAHPGTAGSGSAPNSNGQYDPLNDVFDPLSDSELLDIVLLASVDGKFHALNRTSGHLLWSMPSTLSSSSSSFTAGHGRRPTKDDPLEKLDRLWKYKNNNRPGSGWDNLTLSYPSTLAPLVRTVHPHPRPQPRADPQNHKDEEWMGDGERENEYGNSEQGEEVYIIEPQSGDIYILPPTPSSSSASASPPPLRRFPFTMAQLVEMSPFSFTDPHSANINDEDGSEMDPVSRVFVGRKQTSLLVLELETGRVKGSVGGSGFGDGFGAGGGECLWDPFDDLKSEEQGDSNADADEEELDLDALEAEYEDGDGDDEQADEKKKENERKKQKQKPREVFIGRTDYHISIHTRPSPQSQSRRPRISQSRPRTRVQHLSFSAYHPPHQEALLQSAYTRRGPKDGRYVQSLPGGEVLSFRAWDKGMTKGRKEDGEDKKNKGQSQQQQLLWFQQFDNPIVAAFDVLRRPLLSQTQMSTNEQYHTFVLAQPQPSLADFHPSLAPPSSSSSSSSSKSNAKTNQESDSDSSSNSKSNANALLPNADAAYIGLVETEAGLAGNVATGSGGDPGAGGGAGGSLFAMSPRRFPFVAFGGFEREVKGMGIGRKKLIDDSPSSTQDDDGFVLPVQSSSSASRSTDNDGDDDFDGDIDFKDGTELPLDVDEVTRLRKLREQKEREREEWEDRERKVLEVRKPADTDTCQDTSVFDLRCFVGVHKLERGAEHTGTGTGAGAEFTGSSSGYTGALGSLGALHGPQLGLDNLAYLQGLHGLGLGYGFGAGWDYESVRGMGMGFDAANGQGARKLLDAPPTSSSDHGSPTDGISAQVVADVPADQSRSKTGGEPAPYHKWEMLVALFVGLLGLVSMASVVGSRYSSWAIPMAIKGGSDPGTASVPESNSNANAVPEKVGNGVDGVVVDGSTAIPIAVSTPAVAHADLTAVADVPVPVNTDAVSSVSAAISSTDAVAPEIRVEHIKETSVTSDITEIPAAPSHSNSPQLSSNPLPDSTSSSKSNGSPKPLTNSNHTPPALHLNLQDGDDSDAEADEGEAEGVEGAEGAEGSRTGKKKMRRKRGKKKKGNNSATTPSAAAAAVSTPMPTPLTAPLSPTPTPMLTPTPAVVHAEPAPSEQPPSALVVSETVLGWGSHGTVVFRGSLQGRAVAVKRLLKDFVTLASREVSILQESDDHPNVIRYYYQEVHANFLYIALELCPGSLADVFEGGGFGVDECAAGMAIGLDAEMEKELEKERRSREEWQEIKEAIVCDPKKALKQITSGLRHLHALKLVHRDIKPQNILVAVGPGRGGSGIQRTASFNGRSPAREYRMLISDFGLCKKLDIDQTSFLPTAHGAMGAGTFGWRAPEILRGEVKLDEEEDSASKGSTGSRGANPSSISSNGSSSSASGSKRKQTRLTKSVDIFALGCLFYYMLTAGGHPFGDRFEREVNIIRGVKDLRTLQERFGEEGIEAADLIESMLHADASKRPDTTACLLHPVFWDSGRRLNFLQEASDRFEIMCREPKDARLLALEKSALGIVGADWHTRVDRVFIENLGKFRKYDGRSVQDLLRALRNKKHHYQDLPDNVKRHLGAMPEGYLSYFTRRYPQLFLHVHGVIAGCDLRSESVFRSYFELTE